MRKQVIISAAVALIGVAGVAQGQTYFESSAARATVGTTSFQYPYLGPQVEQGGTGAFARAGDGSRLIADGLVTHSPDINTSTIGQITAGLYVNDADVYKVYVPNPGAFSARIGGFFTSGDFNGQESGAAASLFLFTESGSAIRGGTARQDWTVANNGTPTNDARNVVLTLPGGSPAGFYWIGISRNVVNAFNALVNGNAPTDVIVPRNSAGEKLFDEALMLANPGTVYDVLGTVSSSVLSTARTQSWQVTPFDLMPADPGYIDPVTVDWTQAGTGFAPNTAIVLTGAQFALVPEPASIVSLGLLALGMFSRRRAR